MGTGWAPAATGEFYDAERGARKKKEMEVPCDLGVARGGDG